MTGQKWDEPVIGVFVLHSKGGNSGQEAALPAGLQAIAGDPSRWGIKADVRMIVRMV